MLEDSLGFLINHAGRKARALLGMRFQPYEITTEQWTVLNRLAEQDGLSQKELARRAEKDQTNLTRILGQLERKGLVVRKTNESDRRSELPYITEKGRALNDVLVPIERDVVLSIVRGLTEEQTAALRSMLLHIAEEAGRLIRESEVTP